MGPKYNVDFNHHYSMLNKHVDRLMDLTGPVFHIERDHHFNEIKEAVSGIAYLHGPGMWTDRAK